MALPKRILTVLAMAFMLALTAPGNAEASHIIGGEVTWQCQGNGSYVFFLKLYRDCTQNTFIPTNQTLQVLNHPTLTSIPVTLQSQVDITQPGCGVSCNGAQPGNVAVEEFVFASDPIVLGAVPPAQGFTFVFNQCCRNQVTNLVTADNYTINYRAVMYPLNGLDSDPCYDSSPQFAERPSALLCSGYDLSYNSNAIDVDGDSLSYEFIPAYHETGTVPYAAGYSFNVPLPGPTLDPSYDLVTIDPITGQIEYSAPGGLQGKWNLAYVVKAYRCGQLISENVREMQVWVIPCSEPNNTPVVAAPVWTSPAGASGYNITVNAGELVSFTLAGADPDIVNGVPQLLSLDAVGPQFGSGFTNSNAGCLEAPCATLTSVTPPASNVGSIGTTFTWQTECQHVSVQDQCANYSNTYNFIFKFRDDYCPARATAFVNVSVTVIGEDVLPSPQPHCADVLPGGGIQVSWAPVTESSNPPSFVEYVITHSLNPNGPFTQVGTVANINTGTFSHAGASTTGPNYYQIRTRSGCNGQVLSPAPVTIASIFLTLTDNGSTADLSWNAVATPPFPSSNGNGQGLYQIFKEYPAGTWSQIGSTFDLTWTDPVTVCQEQVNYYVQLTDNLPCISRSNVAGAVLNNPTQPDTQVMDSVTVDLGTQFASMGWQPNGQVNVVEYDVEQQVPQGSVLIWVPQHTAVGYTNNTWLNPNSAAADSSECYRVRAVNGCPGSQPGLASQRHCTIFVTAEAFGCERKSVVSWSPYTGWDNIRGYEILMAEEGGPEVLIGSVPDTIYQFEHLGVELLANYCYRVRAVRDVPGRVTSTSNEACVFVYVPKRPDYAYHYNATVNSTSDAVEQFFFLDSTAGYIGFDVLRGTAPDNMEPIADIDFDPTTRYYGYIDNTARVNMRSYYYAVVGIDSCEQNADTLNTLRTIYLEAEANTDRTNDLTWNAFEGWLGDVAAQNIWRNYDGTWELIATVPPSQLAYNDPIQEFVTGEGRFCYYIEALEGSGPFISPDGVRFQEISRSNEACALQFPNVYTPNAFVPEGLNKEFLPVTVYVDYSDYVFQVYNRWGERVFYATNPQRGWAGIHNGKPAPQGVYGFHIRFVSSSGQVYEKSGTVTLIR
jgi:gliding motility-associated-like protein